jgi:hypothetical protein
MYCDEWFLNSPFQNVCFISLHIACSIHLHCVLTQSTQSILQVDGKNKLNLLEKLELMKFGRCLLPLFSGSLSSHLLSENIDMKYAHIWSFTLCLTLSRQMSIYNRHGDCASIDKCRYTIDSVCFMFLQSYFDHTSLIGAVYYTNIFMNVLSASFCHLDVII